MFDSLMIFKPELLETMSLTALLPGYLKYVHIATKQNSTYLKVLDKMGYPTDYMYYSKEYINFERILINAFDCKTYVLSE